MDEVETAQLKDMVKDMDKTQRIMLYESRRKSAGIALILSFIIPGAGLMYMGKLKKGIVVLLTFWTVVIYVLGLYWSYKDTKAHNALLYTIIVGQGSSTTATTT